MRDTTATLHKLACPPEETITPLALKADPSAIAEIVCPHEESPVALKAPDVVTATGVPATVSAETGHSYSETDTSEALFSIP